MNRPLILACLLWSGAALGGFPLRFHVQGVVHSPAGDAADGSYDVVFRLYDQPTGGAPLWSQTQSPVVIHGGLLDAVVGDGVTPLTPAMLADGELFFSVQFGAGDELPRVAVDPVPLAIAAATALQADLARDLSCVGCVSEAELGFAVATQSELDAVAATAAQQSFDLVCSGCVGESELGFAVATQAELDALAAAQSAALSTHAASGDHDARYVNSAGDTMTGPLVAGAGVSLGGSQLSQFRVHNADGPPVACGPDTLGTLYFDVPLDTLRVCTKVGYVDASFRPTLGSSASLPGASCKAILDAGAGRGSGVYWIKIGAAAPQQLYCDMVTDGGGWTLIRVANGTTAVSLLTDAAVNPAALVAPAPDANAQLAAADADQLGSVLMAVNTASPYATLWYDKNRACNAALRVIRYTFNPSLPSVTTCPTASSVYPPSENKWGVDVGGGGTHINYAADHPLCFGSWASGTKGHVCINRNQWDWWNYGTDANTTNNPNAHTALYIR